MKNIFSSNLYNFDRLINLDNNLLASYWAGLDFGFENFSKLRGLLNLSNFKTKSYVALLTCNSHQEKEIIKTFIRGFKLLNLERIIETKNHITIKPALVEPKVPLKYITTHPNIVGGLFNALREYSPKKISIVEGSGHERDTQLLLEITQIKRVIDKYKIDFIDLNQDDVVLRKLENPLTFNNLYVPKTLFQSDFLVSSSCLKTHHRTAITLGMKNMFGCIPGSIYGFPKNKLHWMSTPRSINDIVKLLSPQLSIIDGIRSIEGNGPLHGKIRKTNIIIMGTDIVSVDIVASQIMGFSQLLVPVFWYALKNKMIREPIIIGDLDCIKNIKPFRPPDNIKWMYNTQNSSKSQKIDLLKLLLQEGEKFIEKYNSIN